MSAIATGDGGSGGSSVPFAIADEEEHLRSISTLRTEVHEKQLPEDGFEPFNPPSDSDVFRVTAGRDQLVGSFRGDDTPLAFSHFGGEKDAFSQSGFGEMISDERSFDVETQGLLESRIRALEEIIDIQNDEIHRSLPLDDDEISRPEFPPAEGALPRRLLELWRQKVFQCLTNVASTELRLSAEKEVRGSLEASIQRLRSRVHSVEEILKSDTSSLKSVLRNKDRRIGLLERELGVVRRERSEILERDRVGSVRERRVRENVADVVGTVVDQVGRLSVVGAQRLRKEMTRIGFLKNRVEMIRGTLVQEAKRKETVIENLKASVEHLNQVLQQRQADESREGGELVSALHKEIASLKRERDFLLESRSDGKEFVEVEVQADLQSEALSEDVQMAIHQKDAAMARLHALLRKAQDALQANLSVVHRLRLDFEKLSAEKTAHEAESSKRIRVLRGEISRVGSVLNKHETTIVAKETELRTLKKEMEAVLESHADLEKKLEWHEQKTRRPRFDFGNDRSSRTSSKPRQSLFGPSVQDSVILKLGELGSMTDAILREEFDEDEEELLRK